VTAEGLDARARALLGPPNVAHVVTRRRDGSPRVVVTWVDVEDGRVVLNARTDRRWVADVRRDPAVVVTVVDLADPYRYVTVEGAAVEAPDGAGAAYRALAERYWGAPAAAAHLPPGDRTAFAVDPRRVRLYLARRPPTD
jgi:PPOX class probable F420-dependent enzyme